MITTTNSVILKAENIKKIQTHTETQTIGILYKKNVIRKNQKLLNVNELRIDCVHL